jgi:hypothetical protein
MAGDVVSSTVRVRVRVNTEVLFNGSLKDWEHKPPDLFKDAILPDSKPEPHLKACMIVMADAVMNEKSVNIDVFTFPNAWSMEVEDK